MVGGGWIFVYKSGGSQTFATLLKSNLVLHTFGFVSAICWHWKIMDVIRL